MKSIRVSALVALASLCNTLIVNAKVTQHTADSIARLLNGNVPPGCDASCSLYTAEHPGMGLANTIFIALLILLGTFWLYNSYQKKKYILVVGVIAALLVTGSYFAAPLFRSTDKIPDTCPVLKPNGKTALKKDTFLAPGNEFESSTDSALVVNAKDTITDKEFASVSGDEFQGPSGDEFKSTSDEFQPAGGEATENNTTAKAQVDDIKSKPLNMTMIYEPVAIFFILALISFFIRYKWFRSLRGLFLLGGLLYFGFYRGACPCMISGFQNGILMLLGVPVRWESALWFFLLVPATYLFGRVWCGWLCHLGALQELIFKSPKLSLLQSSKAQKILKIILISVFVLWILQLLIMRSNLYCTIDPFKAAFNLYSTSLTGWILLGILLIGSVLIYRPFCRTICPVGLVLGWISYIPGAKKLNKNDHCINCKSCNNDCDYRAMIYENKTTTLRNEDCILCGECISDCKKNALSVDRKKRSRKIFPVILLMLLATSAANAQWECPSRLSSNLKPFGDSNLMWSTELISSGGFAGDLGIANLMLFGGLDYSSGKNTFYLEGGLKNWMRFEDQETTSRFMLFGLREAFYRYNADKQNITIGLQSMKSDDDYLINERVAGVNYKLNLKNISLNLQTGSVMKEFARNGTFCTVGYLYNVAAGRERAVLGNDFGQTNLALLSLSYSPGKAASNDEFSGDLGGSESGKSFFKLNSIGALAYSEFGSWVSNRPTIAGLYANTEIAGITFKPELLVQSATDNNAFIYSLYADKQLEWQNGQMTRIFARYTGLNAIDKGAMALNSFSNIFAGEVLRFDALELPFFQSGIKHSFTKAKTSLKLQYALQTGESRSFIADDFGNTGSRMQEIDLSISKNLGKHILINAYAGYLSYPDLENSDGYLVYATKSSPWGKIELRFTF